MGHPSILALAVALLLGGCATFPELDTVVSAEAERAPFPRILPLEDVMAAAQDRSVNAEDAGTTTAARARALQVRAAILRRPVNNPEDADAIRSSLGRLPGPF